MSLAGNGLGRERQGRAKSPKRFNDTTDNLSPNSVRIGEFIIKISMG